MVLGWAAGGLWWDTSLAGEWVPGRAVCGGSGAENCPGRCGRALQ